MDARTDYLRAQYLARARVMLRHGHDYQSWVSLFIWAALEYGELL